MPDRISRPEFIAMMAMLFAVIAFSIDSMLPALGQIGQELSPEHPNRAQLIITFFAMGMAGGTFFTGAISDAFGRKPVVLVGSALYIIGAGLAWAAPSLELMLAARLVQGVGSSGPRVVALAIIRDLHKGREMARIASYTLLVFMLVPALAPLMGTAIIAFAGWRGIFASFVIFAATATLWLFLRLPETLPAANRQPIRLRSMLSALGEMIRHPLVSRAILAQTGCYAVLFITINLVQPVFADVFGREAEFPLWFALMALVGAVSGVINAQLVTRFGMLRLARLAFGTQVALALGITALWISGLQGGSMFAVFILWQCTLFFQNGLTIGNLNALAMEPMGHIAGMAASVMGSVATLGGALMAIPVGLSFDGTLLPLSLGVCGASLFSYLIMRRMPRD